MSYVLQVCGHAAEDISNYKELFPSIFTAQALTNCDMFTLSAEEFHQVVEEYPKVKVKLHAWAVRSVYCLFHLNIVWFTKNNCLRNTWTLPKIFLNNMMVQSKSSRMLGLSGQIIVSYLSKVCGESVKTCVTCAPPVQWHSGVSQSQHQAARLGY